MLPLFLSVVSSIPFPGAQEAVSLLARLGQAGDGKRKNQQGAHTAKFPNVIQPRTQGFSQVRMWNGCQKMLQIST